MKKLMLGMFYLTYSFFICQSYSSLAGSKDLNIKSFKEGASSRNSQRIKGHLDYYELRSEGSNLVLSFNRSNLPNVQWVDFSHKTSEEQEALIKEFTVYIPARRVGNQVFIKTIDLYNAMEKVALNPNSKKSFGEVFGVNPEQIFLREIDGLKKEESFNVVEDQLVVDDKFLTSLGDLFGEFLSAPKRTASKIDSFIEKFKKRFPKLPSNPAEVFEAFMTLKTGNLSLQVVASQKEGNSINFILDQIYKALKANEKIYDFIYIGAKSDFKSAEERSEYFKRNQEKGDKLKELLSDRMDGGSKTIISVTENSQAVFENREESLMLSMSIFHASKMGVYGKKSNFSQIFIFDRLAYEDLAKDILTSEEIEKIIYEKTTIHLNIDMKALETLSDYTKQSHSLAFFYAALEELTEWEKNNKGAKITPELIKERFKTRAQWFEDMWKCLDKIFLKN